MLAPATSPTPTGHDGPGTSSDGIIKGSFIQEVVGGQPRGGGGRFLAELASVASGTASHVAGRLDVNAPIPSAREMAVLYGVASMTAQRALRELQQLRLTYGVPGRGTFVHPDAVDLLRGKLMREPVGQDDPQLSRRVADYLATQDDLFRRVHAARTTAERDQIVTDLVHHADQHRDLIDQMARYQSSHANQGTDPRRTASGTDHPEPEATPAPRRRTTPAKATKTTSTARKTTSSGRTRPGS